MPLIDVLILSNGPGELSTWVRPVVQALRQRRPDHKQLRISVVLSPCANASGRESAMAASYPEVDRVQGVEGFYPFLLWGQTAGNWDWSPQGVVLFLGGDQVYPLVIGKRLGYRTIIYAEWEARWHRWIDRFACMSAAVVAATPVAYRHKCQIIGDLMADVGADPQMAATVHQTLGASATNPLIGLMPGSKPDKLSVGLPFSLATAEAIWASRPDTRFVIPVAPMLSLETLTQFANPEANRAMALFPEAPGAELVCQRSGLPKLRTSSGLEVMLWQPHPAYDLLSQLQICLTTVGANTAELGALAIPMVVLLPTQKLDAMKAWDGIPGLLANLPVVGSPFAKLVNYLALKQILKAGRLFAWPNLWAGQAIVPELIGRLQPQQVATQVVDYLDHPEQLQAMRQSLRSVRGEAGAAGKLADMVLAEAEATPF